MSLPDKDLGIISVLLKRFETDHLPAILSMKKAVEAGETLSDGDVEYLHRMLEAVDVNRTKSLLERHPEYRDLAAAVFSTYTTLSSGTSRMRSPGLHLLLLHVQACDQSSLLR